MLNANLAPGSAVPTQAQLHPSAVAAQVSPPTNPTPPVQIKIQDAPLEPELAVVHGDEDDLDGSEDESLDEDGESERGDGDGDDAASLSLSLSTSISVPDSDTPASETHGTPQVTATARKRPSTELDNDAFDELHPGVTFPTSQTYERGGTPPKRARRHGSFDGTFSSPGAPTPVGKAPTSLADSPSRQRKRSSEELELVDREAPGSGKRMRSDDVTDAPLPSVEKSHAVSPPPAVRTAQLDVRPERRASAVAGVVRAN